MTVVASPHEKAERLNRLLTVWLLRVAGLALFAMGADQWIRLVGVYDGPLGRFDLMPVWWKMAAPTLAVLYPVAGIGLWMTVGWGVVIWALVAVVEAVMHLGFPELFGAETTVLLFHLLGLATFAALKLAGWRQARRHGRRR